MVQVQGQFYLYFVVTSWYFQIVYYPNQEARYVNVFGGRGDEVNERFVFKDIWSPTSLKE